MNRYRVIFKENNISKSWQLVLVVPGIDSNQALKRALLIVGPSYADHHISTRETIEPCGIVESSRVCRYA